MPRWEGSKRRGWVGIVLLNTVRPGGARTKPWILLTLSCVIHGHDRLQVGAGINPRTLYLERVMSVSKTLSRTALILSNFSFIRAASKRAETLKLSPWTANLTVR